MTNEELEVKAWHKAYQILKKELEKAESNEQSSNNSSKSGE